MRQRFADNISERIETSFSRDEEWPAHFQTLEGHSKDTRRTLEGHSTCITKLLFASDNRHVVSGPTDGTIKLWDMKTGLEEQTFEGHTNIIQAIAFHPHKEKVVSMSEDGVVKVWDWKTGLEQHTFKPCPDSTSDTTVLSLNGETVAAICDNDRTVKVFNSDTGMELHALKCNTDLIHSLCLSPDGSVGTLMYTTGAVENWGTEAEGHVRTLMIDDYMNKAMAFSPDGRALAPHSGSTTRLWDARSGRELSVYEVMEDEENWEFDVQPAFSPDSQTLAVLANRTTIRLLDVTTGQKIAALTDNNNAVTVWAGPSYTDQCTLHGHADTREIAFSPDGQMVATGSVSDSIMLWDIEMSQKQQDCHTLSKPVCLMRLSPDGRTVASVFEDNTVQLWDYATGARRQLRPVDVRFMEFAPDSRTLAIGGGMEFSLWDVESGVQRYTQEMMTTLLAVSFAPRGMTLALAVAGGILQVRDIRTGDQVETPLVTDRSTKTRRRARTQYNEVESLVFRPASDTLVTAHSGGDFRFWNTRNWLLERTFPLGTQRTTRLALSSDSQILAGAFKNGMIQLWNVQNGSKLASIKIVAPISDLYFSADDQYFQTSAGPLAIASDHSLQPGLGVLLGDQWVTFQGEKVLWLPVRYRQERHSAAADGTLALGCHDGQVVVLKFLLPE
ncbi:WD40-repeat-containing domain protein [Aspergillus germanicus]